VPDCKTALDLTPIVGLEKRLEEGDAQRAGLIATIIEIARAAQLTLE